MNNKGRILIANLLNRGYKPEFYTMLSEDMFDDPVDKKVLKVLKSGFRYTPDKVSELREVAGLGYAETTELAITVGNTKGWITETDILEFVKNYNEVMVKKLIAGGDIEQAFEYMKKTAGKQMGVIEDYKRHLEENRKGADEGLLGLPTGLPDLDRVTSGFRKSKVWIVGGYNAYGKSYFLTNMVNRLIGMGRRACVITLEMTKEDILDRIIGERLGIGVYELAKTINKEEVSKQISDIEEHINNLDLCILDSIYDINDIVTRVKIENKNRQVDVVFLDFIQLVQDRTSKSLYESLSQISTKLQGLAKELGVCFVILSQISNEAQKDTEYTTFGFKGAGEIGQIADVAIRILRKRGENGVFTEDFTLDVMKNRSGQTGQVLCKITFPSGSITQDNLSNNIYE